MRAVSVLRWVTSHRRRIMCWRLSTIQDNADWFSVLRFGRESDSARFKPSVTYASFRFNAGTYLLVARGIARDVTNGSFDLGARRWTRDRRGWTSSSSKTPTASHRHLGLEVVARWERAGLCWIQKQEFADSSPRVRRPRGAFGVHATDALSTVLRQAETVRNQGWEAKKVDEHF